MIKKYFSWTYVKSHPIMFGVIVIVFGLLLLLLLNRKSSSSSSTNVTSGQSDAQVAAAAQMGMAQLGSQTQIQLATIGANVQIQQTQAQLAMAHEAAVLQLTQNQNNNDTAISLAGLEAQLREAENASNERLTARAQDASLMALNAQLNNALAMQENNNSFQLDYASLAYNSALETVKTNAALQATLGAQSADLQKTLSAQQLDAYKISTAANVQLTTNQQLLSVIPTLKSKDRDESLQIISGLITGHPVSYINPPGPAIINGQLN